MSYASFLAYLFWNERKNIKSWGNDNNRVFFGGANFSWFSPRLQGLKNHAPGDAAPWDHCVGGWNLLWDMEFRASLVGMLAYCLIPFDFISKSGSQSGMMRCSAAGWYQMSTPLNICGPCLHIVKYPGNIYIPLRVDSMWRILQWLILKLKIPFL